jgi:hypothetical protein
MPCHDHAAAEIGVAVIELDERFALRGCQRIRQDGATRLVQSRLDFFSFRLSLRHGRACPGHPLTRTNGLWKMDGRHKGGHDDQARMETNQSVSCA